MVELKLKNKDYLELQRILGIARKAWHLTAEELVVIKDGTIQELYPGNKKLARMHRLMRYLESRTDKDLYEESRKTAVKKRQDLAATDIPEMCKNCKHATACRPYKAAEEALPVGKCDVFGTDFKSQACCYYTPTRPNELDWS